MKTVLCYGDSLTWGYDPSTGGGRHALEDRWPTVLQKALGERVHVITEGLNGRTTAFDDHLAGSDRNGARVLPTILSSHAPIDLVVIMLGTNDMKSNIAGKAIFARKGMERLVTIIRNHDYPGDAEVPDILLVAPPVLKPTGNAIFAETFAGGAEASIELANHYEELADEVGCGFFDAGSVAEASPLDGVHLDAENTRRIGEALASGVRVMLEL
ncbi:SGNH/GDSL hydrolase family protein [Oryzicola mucosus]|uniref:SGNH/GDSL hydrolase family protein n=1 Tax=Oryzicola mucosus TaxID=2767425 RepID=A0A8J6U361_9HYPH|nr:SGNH/GDSL hydrolase family protein [Oryzicola mucosus]MBD0416218.1 SGNH/GDSL hydrolase family protein [Oryzicola mucosus]